MKFILNCIFWTLAIYGFWDILKIIFESFIHKKIKSNGIFLIIATKNQEYQIEGFLRSVVFRILYGKYDYLKNVILTDLNSTDSTKLILEKFSKDYNDIKLIEWNDCKVQLDKLFNSQNK